MADFTEQDLTGATFTQVYLNNARFNEVDLTGAKITNALIEDLEISGDLVSLTVNDVDVVPLIEAELNRRYPERVLMRPKTPEAFREAWDVLERLWAETVTTARSLTPEQLHERVNGEWSFIQTQRHLVFATDAWVCRAVLGDPSPWSPLDLPHDDMEDQPTVPRDQKVRPTLEEVLELRADRQAVVRRVLAALTDEQLAGMTEPVLEPGYPEQQSFAVQRCLGAIINEEWHHRIYTERDLALLRP